MSSASSMRTPWRWARCWMVAWTWRMGVRLKSVTFMLTCARPLATTPMALTPWRPPLAARVGGSHVAGKGAGGGDVGSLEVDVVGDEEAAGSDGGGPGGLVKFGAADVGAA